jgi:hypothetical protein
MVKFSKNWSGRVTRESNALDLEAGVFTWKNPRKIALSLKMSAEMSRNVNVEFLYQPCWQKFTSQTKEDFESSQRRVEKNEVVPTEKINSNMRYRLIRANQPMERCFSEVEPPKFQLRRKGYQPQQPGDLFQIDSIVNMIRPAALFISRAFKSTINVLKLNDEKEGE